jgi:NADH-quinone oxidoreductase subunit J
MLADQIRLGIFLAFGLLTIASAMVVAFSKRIVHAVFALLFTFMGVAGLYGLLRADFLAGAQVMIYVGGILVLLLFGVMLTHKIQSVGLKNPSFQRGPAGAICIVLLGLLLFVIYKTPWHLASRPLDAPTAPLIGRHLMGDFLLPFEVVSFILFAVLVGAAMIARVEKGPRGQGASRRGSEVGR